MKIKNMMLLGGLQGLVCLAVLFTTVVASAPSSTFFLPGQDSSNVTISINIPSDGSGDDIFFHMSAPAGHAWVAFGFGTEMLDALIFVTYPSKNSKNVTVSPRLGLRHKQPTHIQIVDVEVLEGSFVNNEIYNINGRCTGCRSYPIKPGHWGTVHVESTAQPMIYAMGRPDQRIQSDDLEAQIGFHMDFGKFNLNLQAATGIGGVPQPTSNPSGTQELETSNPTPIRVVVHGVLMALCFVLFLPVGSLLISLPTGLAYYLHLIWQIGTVCGVIVGTALGIVITVQYEDKRSFRYAHQRLGVAVVFLLIFVQPTIGLLLHRDFRRKSSEPSLLMVYSHHLLGCCIILLGIVNGALGLRLANDGSKIPPYLGGALLVAIGCGIFLWVFRRKKMRRRVQVTAKASDAREEAPHPYAEDLFLRRYGGTHARCGSVNSKGSSASADQQPQSDSIEVLPKKGEGGRV